MNTKRRTPSKKHPWKQFNVFTSKPAALVDLMGYVAESKDSKKQRRMIASNIVAMAVFMIVIGVHADEKPVIVDRYDVRKLQNDPAVLVASRKPMIESRFSRHFEEEKEIIQAQVIKVQAMPVQSDSDVIIKATISSDDYPEEVEYRL